MRTKGVLPIVPRILSNFAMPFPLICLKRDHARKLTSEARRGRWSSGKIRSSSWRWRLLIVAAAGAREYQGCAEAPIVLGLAEQHDAAVRGKRDRRRGLPQAAAGGELLLLRPLAAAAGEHRCRARIAIVGEPAHGGDVAIGRQRDRCPLLGPNTAG